MRIELNVPDYIKFLPAEKRVDTETPLEKGEYMWERETEESNNYVYVKCKKCGITYRTNTLNGSLWMYNDNLIFYGFCRNCERYTGGMIGKVIFNE